VPHDEPVFGQADFAAQYNAEVGKATPDFKPILTYVGNQLDPAARRCPEIGSWSRLDWHQLAITSGCASDGHRRLGGICRSRTKQCCEGVADRVTFSLGDAMK
jgi:hypothetical protein